MAFLSNDFINNGIYRMKTEHRFHFPVQVRSAGYNRFFSTWHEPLMRKDFLELFWGVSGEFQFSSGILRPNCVCCYFPGDLHEVYPIHPGQYYWITFDGDALPALIEHLQLKREPHAADNCPVSLFQQVMKYLCCSGEYAEWRSGCLGYEILTRSAVTLPPHKENTYVSRFCELVARHFSDPDFSIEKAAQELHIHRSTLTRQMLKEHGMSPLQYLMSCRMQQAEAYLKNTVLLIKEISEQTGFADPNYFARLFQQRNGVSPQTFREQNGRTEKING